MKRVLLATILVAVTAMAKSQSVYDSITISRFRISEEMYGAAWRDTLKLGKFPAHVYEEKTVWVKPALNEKKIPAVIFLSDRIKANGTEDVAKCFIPRHSINYYKGGKISRYLLVCFECDGLRFSDDPSKTFVKNAIVRENQMGELKKLFKQIDHQPEKAGVALVYDSITISKIKGGWNMLEPGKNVLVGERSVWKSSQPTAGAQPDIATLTDSIKINGTGPIGRCFFPRHRVNYYKDGMVELYLLVCFECNELQFSNDNFPEMFVKDRPTRMRQMEDLRAIFKDMLSEKN